MDTSPSTTIGLIILALCGVLLAFFANRPPGAALPEECRAAYRAARTAADTAVADMRRPRLREPTAPSCGQRRQLLEFQGRQSPGK